MSKDFIKQLEEIISCIEVSEKKKFFTISTTSKIEKKPYLTPIRQNRDFVVSGCVIFDLDHILDILSIIDGRVDFILVDSEKKVPFKFIEDDMIFNNRIYSNIKTLGFIDTCNISKVCFSNVEKSKIYEYKPNDLTVNATWQFLSQRFRDLSGRRICIIGAGNIGAKLSLKLVECGSHVNINRKNHLYGHFIEQGLNCIKPKNTVSKIEFHDDPIKASFMSEVLIGSTNGIQVITIDIIKSLAKQSLIIDLGKNNISEDAISYALEKNIEIYRTDVSATFEGYIYEVLKMEEILQRSYGKRDLGYCNIVGGGFFGLYGDIVVDSIMSPGSIVGVSAGDGSLKKKINEEDKKRIQRLKEEFKIDTPW